MVSESDNRFWAAKVVAGEARNAGTTDLGTHGSHQEWESFDASLRLLLLKRPFWACGGGLSGEDRKSL